MCGSNLRKLQKKAFRIQLTYTLGHKTSERIKEEFSHDSVTALPSYFIRKCKHYFWLPGAVGIVGKRMGKVGIAFSAIHAGTNPEQVILRCNSEELSPKARKRHSWNTFLVSKRKKKIELLCSVSKGPIMKRKDLFPLPFKVHLVQG